MFDVGFLELIVVMVIGLLVIGPEKLPEAVRACALWIGRIKRVLRDARSEFEQQIGADEIRREIHNEQVLKSLQKLKQQREELERQIRQAATTDEEKYEDTHFVQQTLHDPIPEPNHTATSHLPDTPAETQPRPENTSEDHPPEKAQATTEHRGNASRKKKTPAEDVPGEDVKKHHDV